MIDQERRVAIVDDHPLLRAGLAVQLAEAGLTVELPELLSPTEMVSWIARQSLACVVLDLGLPIEGGGLALIEPVVATGTVVVVLTGEADPSLWAESIGKGAETVLAKTEPLADIVEAIRMVCDGGRVRSHQRSALWAESRRLQNERDERLAPFLALSPREGQVLAGLMEGHGPAELAKRDFVSIETVRTQVKSVLRKLGVRSQLEAVARANTSGWQSEDTRRQRFGHA